MQRGSENHYLENLNDKIPKFLKELQKSFAIAGIDKGTYYSKAEINNNHSQP